MMLGSLDEIFNMPCFTFSSIDGRFSIFCAMNVMKLSILFATVFPIKNKIIEIIRIIKMIIIIDDIFREIFVLSETNDIGFCKSEDIMKANIKGDTIGKRYFSDTNTIINIRQKYVILIRNLFLFSIFYTP